MDDLILLAAFTLVFLAGVLAAYARGKAAGSRREVERINRALMDVQISQRQGSLPGQPVTILPFEDRSLDLD